MDVGVRERSQALCLPGRRSRTSEPSAATRPPPTMAGTARGMEPEPSFPAGGIADGATEVSRPSVENVVSVDSDDEAIDVPSDVPVVPGLVDDWLAVVSCSCVGSPDGEGDRPIPVGTAGLAGATGLTCCGVAAVASGGNCAVEVGHVHVAERVGDASVLVPEVVAVVAVATTVAVVGVGSVSLVTVVAVDVVEGVVEGVVVGAVVVLVEVVVLPDVDTVGESDGLAVVVAGVPSVGATASAASGRT
jgi:hypothetical protein